MKPYLLKWARRTQAHRLTRRWFSHRLTILTYHGLTDRKHQGIENYHGKHLDVRIFGAHLEYLARYHQVVSLDEVVDRYAHGVALPPRSVVLTFDDGYQSVYRLGWPLLRRHGLPAAFFLATNFVSSRDWLWTDRLEYALNATTSSTLDVNLGTGARRFDLRTPADRIATEYRLRMLLKTIPQERLHALIDEIETRLNARLAAASNPSDIYRPVAWTEVEEMQRSGLVSIGSHTASHVILARCTEQRVREELSTSRQVIEQQTGEPCRLFCYPNGQPGSFNARTREFVRRAGYRCALTTMDGLNGERADVFALKRLSIVDDQPDRFALTLSGMVGHADAFLTSARRLVGARPH